MLKISDRYCERQSSNRALIRDNDRVSIFLKKKKKKIKRDNFPNRSLIQYTYISGTQLFNEAFHDHFVLYQNLGEKFIQSFRKL